MEDWSEGISHQQTSPAACSSVHREVPEGFEVRTEGRASILQQGNDAFFNPAQVSSKDSVPARTDAKVHFFLLRWTYLQAIRPHSSSLRCTRILRDGLLMKVINRDISVAVLRQLVKIRREELESGKMKARAIKSNAPKCLDATALADRLASDRKDITILEGLAASGLRAIRYALEVRLQQQSRNCTYCLGTLHAAC